MDDFVKGLIEDYIKERYNTLSLNIEHNIYGTHIVAEWILTEEDSRAACEGEIERINLPFEAAGFEWHNVNFDAKHPNSVIATFFGMRNV